MAARRNHEKDAKTWAAIHASNQRPHIVRNYRPPAPCDVAELKRQAAQGRELMKEMQWNS